MHSSSVQVSFVSFLLSIVSSFFVFLSPHGGNLTLNHFIQSVIWYFPGLQVTNLLLCCLCTVNVPAPLSKLGLRRRTQEVAQASPRSRLLSCCFIFLCVHYASWGGGGGASICLDVVYLWCLEMGTVELNLHQGSNSSLLQSSISGSIKILSSCFLYGCLWKSQSFKCKET